MILAAVILGLFIGFGLGLLFAILTPRPPAYRNVAVEEPPRFDSLTIGGEVLSLDDDPWWDQSTDIEVPTDYASTLGTVKTLEEE